ncbi:excinuclease ABC subunit UvrB [Candidatus Parcubacteria bacterium]|nr:MAG: excinuclease ABC subunit UvrB [Candidatus Parcubacteria bacterium]
MDKFVLKSKFNPRGDQPKAIENLVGGINLGLEHQTLLGVTGSGKTYTMAKVIESIQRPTLIISPNKTLAAQLYQEFKDFFPKNEVHYFVSYYDYYQPEAYIPQTDTYIAKDAKIDEDLDKYRHGATQALLTKRSVIVIASVSCIYNIGSPAEYHNLSLLFSLGQKIGLKNLLSNLVSLQYSRNEVEKLHGTFRVRGSLVEIYPATGGKIFRIEIGQNKIMRILAAEDSPQPSFSEIKEIRIFPAKYWVAPSDTLKVALNNIRAELSSRLRELKAAKKLLEAERLEWRTNNDLAMLEKTGYCAGVENYSSHLEFRKTGSPPFTLIDYFLYAQKLRKEKDPFLCILDESHLAIPQIRGMWHGERARKEVLINYGWRLPSAIDNRPLTFEEFDKKASLRIYASATPGPYEYKHSEKIVEQFVRPTGLLDPTMEVRPTEGQINDLIEEIKKRVIKKQRVLVSALTKRLSEELTDYLKEEKIKVQYLHSEVKTLERPEILKDLREGKYDVLVGVNLLREGLDLPEVSLVAILDADKEGFLRNSTTLIQMAGRAARHVEGAVIMYADTITGSIKAALEETRRRRKIQEKFNKQEGIIPRSIIKQVSAPLVRKKEIKEETDFSLPGHLLLQAQDGKKILRHLRSEMKKAASELDFEKAVKLRDQIRKLEGKS